MPDEAQKKENLLTESGTGFFSRIRQFLRFRNGTQNLRTTIEELIELEGVFVDIHSVNAVKHDVLTALFEN